MYKVHIVENCFFMSHSYCARTGFFPAGRVKFHFDARPPCGLFKLFAIAFWWKL